MKNKKKKIAKIVNLMIIPILNLSLVICVSLAFAKPNYVNNENKNENENLEKNEKFISVYFHNSDEVKNVPLEEYLLGVVSAEMPPSFELEALKAQAVAARTYIINREGGESAKEHKGAIICTDFNHCKAYITEEEAVAKWQDEWINKYKEKIKKAVDDTNGMIVTYNDEPISAVFHSTSSGKTENSEDVWQSALPYLRSVESEGEEKSPRYTSEESFTYDEFKKIVLNEAPEADFSQNPKSWTGNITYNDSGSVKTIIIGGVEFKGTDVRKMFSLRSATFSISQGENIVFKVTGNGHGVGMSQYGANYAAQNGYTFEQILKKYYQGVEITRFES